MKRSGNRGKRNKGSAGRRKAGGLEWVGGRVLAPFLITEDEPYRPEMCLWVELPDELVVHGEVIDPKEPPVSLADALIAAMESPLVGPPRRPSRIRVADSRLAAEIAGAARGIEIVVAPTPEVDSVLQAMAESFTNKQGDEEFSYFEGGRVSVESVEGLFCAAEVLFPVAPWKAASDGQVLRLDIPQLGVEGACVSIIGALGESMGVLIFRSLMAYERFRVAAESFDASGGGPVDMGTSILSLNFERGADLPGGMRREIAKHGWPVAGPDAYPWVQKRGRDGMLVPVTDRDVRIVSACAASLAAFFIKHGRLFELEVFKPVCESWYDQEGLEVRFTAPYEADILFEANTPRPADPAPRERRVKVGRNAPCPCGSGKKYKKCCLGKDEAWRQGPAEGPAEAAAPEPAPFHRLDERLVDTLFRFSAERFGKALSRSGNDFSDPDKAMELWVPWAVYHFLIKGKPVVQWFWEERGSGLSKSMRTWIEAQRASWLSIWEVTAVDSGRGRLVLKDLLSGEERTVREVEATKSLVHRDVVLGRVVDHDGISVLCGVYPRSLPPMEAAEVIRRVRGRLRRKRAVPVERLRDEKLGRYMIRIWEEAVAEMDFLRGFPPRLQNTEGEDFLITVDHFEFEPAARSQVEERLGALDGVEPPGPDDPNKMYRFIQPGKPRGGGLERTLAGTVRLVDGKLRLETNSVRRADRLRAQIEEGCGELLRHRMREHSDPSALLERVELRRPQEESPLPVPPDVAARLVREFKEKHYADWIDQPLPALGGMTARAAVRTKEGARWVDVLLKDMENHECRLPEEERFCFSGIRKELGLDP